MVSSDPSATRDGPVRALTYVLAALCMVAIVRAAWLSDDAYITLRSAKNVVEGYGPVWNVDERVQAFTHPLWMGVLTVAFAITGEAFYTVTFLCLGLAAVFLVLFVAPRGRAPWAVLIAVLGLTASKAFVEFSTSGLENALTHVLVLLTWGVLWKRAPGRRQLLFVSLLACLAVLNRQDALFLVAPACVASFLRARASCGAWRLVGAVAIGFAPLVLWELFSVVYYGFPVPNTAYAKLNTGISGWLYALQGARYVAMSSLVDSPSAILIGLAIVVGVRERELLPASIALVLALLFIVRVGGDFMVGRFLSAPVALAALVVARSRTFSTPRAIAIPALLFVLNGSLSPLSTWRQGPDLQYEPWGGLYWGICDERSFYYHTTGLLRADRSKTVENHVRSRAGDKLRERAGSSHAPAVGGPIGFAGFRASEAILIDKLALSDPLLARLPTIDPERWRIGHFTRAVPDGYTETRQFGENRIVDPDLARYYDRLSLVTRGDLFDGERWRAIWELNTGQLDPLLDAYVARTEGRQ